MTVVADTGAIYALVDGDDAWHARVFEWWRSESRDVVLPVTVLPEVCYLLQTRIGPDAELAFAQALAQDEFTLEPVDGEDLIRVAELMEDYKDLTLGFVDASIAAVADRLETREILTTDRRHFSVVRPRRGNFILVP